MNLLELLYHFRFRPRTDVAEQDNGQEAQTKSGDNFVEVKNTTDTSLDSCIFMQDRTCVTHKLQVPFKGPVYLDKRVNIGDTMDIWNGFWG